MKPKKILALLLTLALAAALCACAQTPAGDKTGAVSVTDMADPARTVSLDAPAQRIVVLDAADVEILYALGAGDRLVGRGQYCDWPAEAADVPAVASGAETNIEEILALDPQVVIMSIMDQTVEQVAALENAGVPVAATNANTLSGVYEAIRLVGALCGKDAEADALVNDMVRSLAELATEAEGDGTETVYFEVSPLEYGLWTAGKNTFMDELCTALGVTNAFADVDGWAEISEEQVLERDPDYIVTIGMYFGEGPTPVEEILSRGGWQNLQAVQNGRVFQADSDSLSRPGPRLIDGARQLYGFFNPTAE